jgi:lysophospholipase
MNELANVLILYTGGTIGMQQTDRGYAPSPGYLAEHLQRQAAFHDPDMPLYTTPPSWTGKRVHYDIIEYDPLLDSSNMGLEDWAHIAGDVAKYYDQYDGFLVLHGTDTMAYTASALSFMLEGLRKPVILTGSQIPISRLRSDAMENVLGALIVAGHYVIPEVGLYFAHKLMRGNRAGKVDAAGLDAFESANCDPLVEVGTEIKVRWNLIETPRQPSLRVQTEMSSKVAVLRLFPGISVHTIRNFLRPPIEGIVMETFGSGNAPNQRQDFLDALKEATDRGVVIVNTTQCDRGSVTTGYAAGQALYDHGVISGGDMTAEAALTKLSYLLARESSTDQVRKKMQQNLRGERTPVPSDQRFSFSEASFVRAVAQALAEAGQTGADDLEAIERAIYPVLSCSAAALGDVAQLRRLQEASADMSQGDYDGRTPLHLAVSEGHVDAVRFLVELRVDIEARDRWGNTPLLDAQKRDQPDIAEILLRAGKRVPSQG